jgi:hypothetical protein
MGEYWKPTTKKDLIIWIKSRYFNIGQCVAGLERKPIKQLRAIYYELIRRIKEPVQL